MAAPEQVALPRRSRPEAGAEARPRPGLAHVPARPARVGGAQREVHVLVVGEVRLVEEADLAQHRDAQERRAAAHAGHRPVAPLQLLERQAEVAVARASEAVDGEPRRIDALLVLEEQRAREEPRPRLRARRLAGPGEPFRPPFPVLVDPRYEPP